MKKIHITVSLLLSALLLLSGCSENISNSAPADDISSMTVSQPESTPETKSTTQSSIIESTQNHTETVSSTESSSTVSSTQSTPEDVEPVPVEFTDEDRELQKILSELKAPTSSIVSWFNYISVPTDLYPDAADWRLIIPEISFDGSCKRIPDNLKMAYSMFDVPTSKAGMEELFHKYFSTERTNELLRRIPVCESIERSGKSITLKLKDDPEIYQKEGFQIWFVEVDGRLYVPFSQGVSPYIEADTAKVTKRTDDTIEFIYVESPAYSKEEIINDTSYYLSCARNGIIKLEDGVWKMHFWDDMHFPLLN